MRLSIYHHGLLWWLTLPDSEAQRDPGRLDII